MPKKRKLVETIDPSRNLGGLYQVIPSTIDPIQRIEAEGNAYRNLRRGDQPWWIIVSSWIFIALPMAITIFALFYMVISEIAENPDQAARDATLVPTFFLLVLISALPGTLIYVVIKGTRNKLRIERRKLHKDVPVAGELEESRGRVNRKFEDQLVSKGELKASIFEEEEVRTDGRIWKTGEEYQLEIITREGSRSRVALVQAFQSQHALETHLEAHTSFRLGDFIRSHR